MLDDPAGRGRRDGGEARVAGTGPAGPVHERGGGPEHDGGGLDDPPLQQPYEMGAGALGMCAVVPGDDERGTPPAEREHRTEGGVQPVRVDQVGVRARGPQRGHGGGIAAARDMHVFGAGAREVVELIGLHRGAHGDPHAPRDQPGGQRPHMRAAAGVAAAQHLHGAQRGLAVR